MLELRSVVGAVVGEIKSERKRTRPRAVYWINSRRMSRPDCYFCSGTAVHLHINVLQGHARQRRTPLFAIISWLVKHAVMAMLLFPLRDDNPHRWWCCCSCNGSPIRTPLISSLEKFVGVGLRRDIVRMPVVDVVFFLRFSKRSTWFLKILHFYLSC